MHHKLRASYRVYGVMNIQIPGMSFLPPFDQYFRAMLEHTQDCHRPFVKGINQDRISPANGFLEMTPSKQF